MELKSLPPFGEACVCVTLGVIGMLLQLFILQQGGWLFMQVPAQRRGLR